MRQYKSFMGPGYDVNKLAIRGTGDFYSKKKADIIYRAIRKAGVNFICWLPDTWLSEIFSQIVHDKDPDLIQVHVSKEDEGMAIAVGASLAGKIPAMVMEGSGIGTSGIVLSRFCIVQQIPILIIASHTSGIGEIAYYHAETRVLAEPILSGLRVPYYILRDVGEAEKVFRHSRLTLEGQRTPVAVLLSRESVWEEGEIS
jgi:sulfopyruvate decarboxylase TPP-binding subunit